MENLNLLRKHIAKAVETKPAVPNFFGQFFGNIDVHGQSVVSFDQRDYTNGIAPLVRPEKDGKPVSIQGFSNSLVKLPTIKSLSAITTADLEKRPFSKNDEVATNAVVRQLTTEKVDDNERRIDVRLEALRADAIFNGTTTLSGDDYDNVIEWGRKSEHSFDVGAVNPANYWDGLTPNVKKDITAFITTLASSGKSATHIVGRQSVIAYLVDAVKGEVDFRRVEDGQLKFKSLLDVDGSIYYGTYRGIEIWGYDGVYTDENGATAYMTPEKKIAVLCKNNGNEMSYGYAPIPSFAFGKRDIITTSDRNVIHSILADNTNVSIEAILTALPLLKDPNSTISAKVLA